MKFQFVSDIHLEIDPVSRLTEFIKPCAPYLVLAGDICAYSMKDRLRPFLEFCAANWKRVFYVAGNHEYYNKSSHELRFISKQDPLRGQPTPMVDVEMWLRHECGRFANVCFLQKDVVYIQEESTYVLGCTLWSGIAPDKYELAKSGMVDYRRVYASAGVLVTPAEVTSLWIDHANWLLAELGKVDVRDKVLVITHHLPSFTMIDPKYEGNPLNTCFASETLEKLPRQPAAWVCGHSHIRTCRVIGRTLCVLNARGYPGEMPKMSSAVPMPVVELGWLPDGSPGALGGMVEAPPVVPKKKKAGAAAAAVEPEEEVMMM
jgi:predicted phosphodiesterase